MHKKEAKKKNKKRCPSLWFLFFIPGLVLERNRTERVQTNGSEKNYICFLGGKAGEEINSEYLVMK